MIATPTCLRMSGTHHRQVHSLPASVMVVAAIVLIAGACGDDRDTRSETYGLPSRFDDMKSHEWVLDTVGSEPSIAAGQAVTISFSESEVSGSGPCNLYRADFSIDGDDVEISDIVSTLRSCRADVDQAEATYFASLEAVESAEIDDDVERVELTGDDDVLLVFDAYDADELLVGAWNVTNIATGGAIESVIDGTNPVLTFAGDGTLTATAGCNTINAGWELDGDHLSISTRAVTQMFCEGVMDQEAAMIAALDATDRITLTPDTLTLVAADGSIALIARSSSPNDE